MAILTNRHFPIFRVFTKKNLLVWTKGIEKLLHLLVGDARNVHAVKAEHPLLNGLAVLHLLAILEYRVFALLFYLVVIILCCHNFLLFLKLLYVCEASFDLGARIRKKR